MHFAKVISFGAISVAACNSVESTKPVTATETPWSVIYVDTLKADGATKFGGQCLHAPLPMDADGGSRCVVITATSAPAAGAGHCAAPGQVSVPQSDEAALRAVMDDSYERASIAQFTGVDLSDFCELSEMPGSAYDPSSARYRCANSPADTSLPVGWCYIDPAADPPVGTATLAGPCPNDGAGRLIRFAGVPSPGLPTAAFFIVCPSA